MAGTDCCSLGLLRIALITVASLHVYFYWALLLLNIIAHVMCVSEPPTCNVALLVERETDVLWVIFWQTHNWLCGKQAKHQWNKRWQRSRKGNRRDAIVCDSSCESSHSAQYWCGERLEFNQLFIPWQERTGNQTCFTFTSRLWLSHQISAPCLSMSEINELD